MQFGKLLHPIAMKQQRFSILTPFHPHSQKCRNTTPMNRGYIVIASIVSVLCLFFSTASAQHITQAISLNVSGNDTITALPKQFTNSPHIISGIVIDNEKEPLIGASVLLLPKSEVIIGTIANEEGKFRLEIPASYTKDSVLIRVNYLGFFTEKIGLSLRQNNDHVEVCLPRDPRKLGCPVINPYAQPVPKHQINQDLIREPEGIKIPGNKS